MFAIHKKAKNIHSSLTELALYDTSRVCPVSTPSSAVLLYKVEARWQSALWQEMSSSPIMLWISSVWGQSVVGILFINPHSHIKLVPNPLLPSPPKKNSFLLLFMVNSKQSVTVLPLELTLDRPRAPGETTRRSCGSGCLRKLCISESAQLISTD